MGPDLLARRWRRGAASIAAARAIARSIGCGAALLAGWSCAGGGGHGAVDEGTSIAAQDPLTDVLAPADVDAIVTAAAQSADSPRMTVAVVDRTGALLRLWSRAPGAALALPASKFAAALARSAALCSSSQGPLPSRALLDTASFHFPALFDSQSLLTPFDPNSMLPGIATVGLAGTEPGPWWEIETLGRGAGLESPFTTPPTAYAPGKAVPASANPDGSVPTPGTGRLAGGFPLYKRVAASLAAPGSVADVERLLVGGVGVYVGDPAGDPVLDEMEYAAYSAARALSPATGEPFAYGEIANAGVLHLDGLLLPYCETPQAPAGIAAGVYDGLLTLFDSGVPGAADPDGALIEPRDSASAVAFAGAEVSALLDACEQSALDTHAALRLPGGSPARIVACVVDVEGVILGLARMQDAPIAGVDQSAALARSALYFSDPAALDLDGPRAGLHPLYQILPAGVATSTRALWFLSQPLYPPGIDGLADANALSELDACAPGFAGGPLYCAVLENRKPYRFDQLAFAPIDTSPGSGVQPDTQNALAAFPGGFPLFRDGALLGALGVAGDAPAQCELVALRAIATAELALGIDLEPDPALRCDAFEYQDVVVPYAKLPITPDG
jgi:uncharacterized protein GlcG (DUF336 family)